MLLRLYRIPTGQKRSFEECFYGELQRTLAPNELDLLNWLITEPQSVVGLEPNLQGAEVVEIGPRLSVETPFSSSAVAICQSMGLPVCRVEKSTRYHLRARETDHERIVRSHLDLMTQAVYDSTLLSFDSGREVESVRTIYLLEEGKDALRRANQDLGLGMDDWDITYYLRLFQKMGRNPTDVELFQLGNANSEHSRHWFFRGIQVIDGVEMPESLMDIVKAPWKYSSNNSLVAFHDNSGVIEGPEVEVLLPAYPGQSSGFIIRRLRQHITATAETHNHPTLIAPFPGAETGAGGRIRDNRAVGRGGLVHAGLAGYFGGNLHIPGHYIPGETVGGEEVPFQASPLQILIEGSNGVSDYGNKIGEPLILGFCRSVGLRVGGVRREARKPVLYTGGLGRVLESHVEKRTPQKGMLIVRMGGPGYRIGLGGGSHSSVIVEGHGKDLGPSVQRGNAEMENRVNRVIQACAELLERNPIESIHDQGAGGPSNVLTELMEPLGGRVNIRKIILGDRTMSVLEIWGAEFQEGYGLLVKPKNIEVLRSICIRERVNCEELGEITGDGNIVVYDPVDDTTPVNLSLNDILGDLPQKQFESKRQIQKLEPLVIPKRLRVEDALRMVLKLPSVGSKGFLVHKVDRSVTGLVARQQCCGPMQVPVSDVAVTADGYFGLTGAATALGEQPIKMLIDPAAGARMAVAEMLTNLCSAKITKLPDVKCRANWMWAAKRPGEGALLYDAAIAMRDIMLKLDIAIDGGKDSLSMATQVGDELVVSPGELVVMGYAPVPDITKVVTPDFKGDGLIGFIDLGFSEQRLTLPNRLGGSALAQALGQLGDESPDIDDPDLLRRAFEAMQELIAQDLITAYHDRSDGGLIITVAEMCIAGNCGARLHLYDVPLIPELFNEEAGMVFECKRSSWNTVMHVLRSHQVPSLLIGNTDQERPELRVTKRRNSVFSRSIVGLRQWWEATSIELEKQQSNPETVEAERRSHARGEILKQSITFVPTAPSIVRDRAPTVGILREEGTNGDREMAAAFYTAGLEPWDITMSDLLEGRVTSLDNFRGLVFPGGFSYADVFGSGKGWAGPILFNPRLRELFDRFYERPDTFSLGVCNGAQLMSEIGWVPYRGIPDASRPRLIQNKSGRFESRRVGVRILPNPAVLLRGMEGSVLSIDCDHGEGQWSFSDPKIAAFVRARQLVCLEYVDPDGCPTETYPYNPNGSPEGWTALCSPDGRHLAMMPHPERSFLKWQWPWMPEQFRNLDCSPWLQMFQNAKVWCLEH